MLNAKFKEHRTSGSGEEDFLNVFTIYGHGGHLGHVTWTIYINFRSPFLKTHFGLHNTLMTLSSLEIRICGALCISYR